MKNIVILGCENSHAHTFLKILADNPAYSDIRCVGVYSNEAQPAGDLHDLFGVPVLSAYDACVSGTESVDGVMITARDGKNHYRYAQPYLKAGIPTFVDKPVTSDIRDAVMLASEAKRYGTAFTGGSCCKYADFVRKLKNDAENDADGKTVSGLVRAPISLTNNYGGFWFYSEHLVDMVTEIYGRYPVSVRAARSGNKLSVLFRYPDYDVTGLWLDGNYRYYAARYAENGESCGPCDIGQTCFDREFEAYARILRGGNMPMSYADFIAPVSILTAVEQALESGNEVPVSYVEV